MARTPKLGTYKQKRRDGSYSEYWSAKRDGKRKLFGQTKDVNRVDAEKAFGAWLAAGRVEKARIENHVASVEELLARHLRYHRDAGSKDSHIKNCRSYFRRFCAWVVPRGLAGSGKAIGELAAHKITSDHLRAYIVDVARYSPKTRRHIETQVIAAYNWAVDKGRGGFLGESFAPFRGYRRTTTQRKTHTEYTLQTDDAYEYLVARMTHAAQSVYKILYHTGARPSEIVTADIASYSPSTASLVLGDWKNAKKQNTVRHIVLNAECKAIVERHIGARESGPIFRTVYGEAYSYNALKHSFYRAQKGSKYEHIKLYDLRHKYISEALRASVPIATVAKMCGTSVGEIERTYGHFCSDQLHDAQSLLDAARTRSN